MTSRSSSSDLGDVTHKALLEDYQNQQLEVIELEKAARAVAQICRGHVQHQAGHRTARVGTACRRVLPPYPGTPARRTWEISVPLTSELQRRERVSWQSSASPAGSAASRWRRSFRQLRRRRRGTLRRSRQANMSGSRSAAKASPWCMPRTTLPVQYCGAEPRYEGTDLLSASGPGSSRRSQGNGGCRSCLTTRSPVSIPMRQKAACQVLRSLGTKTQVILFTSNPALKAAGDAVAELK